MVDNLKEVKEFYDNAILNSKNEYEMNGWTKPEQNSLVNEFIGDYVQLYLQNNGEDRDSVQIVDVGCGSGMLGDHLKDKFYPKHVRYIGVDLNEKFIEINANKGNEIYIRDITKEEFNFSAPICFRNICVFSGIFAVFPEYKIKLVLDKAVGFYNTIMVYALDEHLCDVIEKDRHNYMNISLLKYFKSNGFKTTKVCFPDIYHSVVIAKRIIDENY